MVKDARWSGPRTGWRYANQWPRTDDESGLEASGAVNATKSECSALPQNGTENDEPERQKHR